MSFTKFKVGDKVRVVDPFDNLKFFSKGAEGVVVGNGMVRFVSGTYDHDCDGIWLADEAGLELIKPYSSTFTKSTKAPTPTGHTSDGGGLQKHSVGNAYPLSIVGYATGDTVTYRIENLTTEVVFGNVHKPLAWADIHTATWMLTLWLKHGNKLGGIAWHPRKPKPELAGY